MNDPNRPLEIALVSTCALATPPHAYGGTELVVAELAKALVALGHRPTVFATGDSACAGIVRSKFPEPAWPPDDLAELRHAAFAWREIARGSFDVVHVNHAAAVPFTDLIAKPTVATVHHERVDSLARHYASYPKVAYVAISQRQRDLSPDVRMPCVIHHGVDLTRYPPGDGKGGYCAYLGRFAAIKGPHVAIDAARAAGTSIRLGGEAHPVERRYFEQEIAPRLRHDCVEWVGEVGGGRKVELLGGASCLLFPIAWEEPFGLVMIEAMLVGTPVIAFARGSVPEVVEEGVTGHVVRDVDEMIERLRSIGRFDRERCRRRALERWSATRMAREYVELYRRVLAL